MPLGKDFAQAGLHRAGRTLSSRLNFQSARGHARRAAEAT